MTRDRLRALVACLVMVAAAAAAYAWRPTQFMADIGPKLQLNAMFPQHFGDWRIDESVPVILPSPDVQAKLDAIYNQVLSRTYVRPDGQRVMLSVAYGGDQSDGTRAHRPEVCYPAQGFQLLSNQDGTVSLDDKAIPARKMVAKLGGRIEPIIYWVVVGETIALSGTGQKLAQLRYGVKGIVPDGMLVRVSTIDADAGRSFAVQQEFIRDLYHAVPAGVRGRVFGDGGQRNVAAAH